MKVMSSSGDGEKNSETTHDNGKGYTKVMGQSPVSLEFLFISKLCQPVLVAFLIAVGGPSLHWRFFKTHFWANVEVYRDLTVTLKQR